MNCKKCIEPCIKKGFQKNGVQKFLCKKCLKWQQEKYQYKAYDESTNKNIVILLKESCGIRSISRILNISTTTITKRILQISSTIRNPPISLCKSYEVDEMMTFVGCKKRKICITYAIDRITKDVVLY